MNQGEHTTDWTCRQEDPRARIELAERFDGPRAFALAPTRREGVSYEYAYLWGWRSR